MPTIDHLLAQVFERKGYSVTRSTEVRGASGTVYEVPVTATRGSETLLVFWKNGSPLTADELAAYARVVTDAAATRGVVLALDDVTASLPDAPVEVWPPTRAVLEVGETVLFAALSASTPARAPAPPEAVAQARTPTKVFTDAQPAIPQVTPGTASADTAAPTGGRFPSLIGRAAGATMNPSETTYLYGQKPRRRTRETTSKTLPYAWGASAAAATAPTHAGVAEVLPGRPRATEPAPVAAESPVAEAEVAPRYDPEDVEITAGTRAAPEVASDAPAETTTGSTGAPDWNGPEAPGNTMAVCVGREEAITRANVTPTAARLVLEPYVCFDYNASVTHQDLSEPITGAGTVLVHAVAGEVREGPAFTAATRLPEAAEPPAEARITAADVYERVKGTLKQKFTRDVPVMKEYEETEVYSNARVKPRTEDLGLDHRGLVNVPVWVLTTEDGVVRVDASTGDVL